MTGIDRTDRSKAVEAGIKGDAGDGEWILSEMGRQFNLAGIFSRPTTISSALLDFGRKLLERQRSFHCETNTSKVG